MRSLRKQLCPRQPPLAPCRRPRPRTSGGPSSALRGRGGGCQKSRTQGPTLGRRDGVPGAATALTRRLKELRRRHPLGEADLPQVVTHRRRRQLRLQLWWGLARSRGRLVARQPLGPVRCRLEALQLPLPVRAPVPTVAEGAATGRRAGRREEEHTEGCQGSSGPRPSSSRTPEPPPPRPHLPAWGGPFMSVLCGSSPTEAPSGGFRGSPSVLPISSEVTAPSAAGEQPSAPAGWWGGQGHPAPWGRRKHRQPPPAQHPALPSPGTSVSFSSLGGFCSSILPPASLGGARGCRKGREIHQCGNKGPFPNPLTHKGQDSPPSKVWEGVSAKRPCAPPGTHCTLQVPPKSGGGQHSDAPGQPGFQHGAGRAGNA